MGEEQNSAQLNSFEFEGRPQLVSFVETTKVAAGVECDVYKFDGDETKDLGVIRIEPGGKTPLQRVLKGDRTVEGYVSGKGKLIITKPDNTQEEHPVNDGTLKPFTVTVAIGETMQWQADKDSPLVAYEICFPPYEDGRFENLSENPVSEFAGQYNIDISRDIKSNPKLTPRLAKLDANGATRQHISEAGAVYTFSQIDYCEGDEIRASRTIAAILPGNRTEFAYWTKAAPSQTLDIHRGRGKLIIGDPNNGTMRALSLDSGSIKEVMLPSGSFYTIQADEDSTEPLVISGFYDPPLNWDDVEIPLNPGQDSVKAPEGVIQVPSDFRAAFDMG